MDQPEDIERLAADWIALWESELAALGQDAELAESWAASVALMAAFWRAQSAHLAAAMKWRGPDEEPPRPAPAAAASPAGGGARDGGAGVPAAPPGAKPLGDGPDVEQLRARLAELERRLATLEGGAAGGGEDRPRPRKPRTRRKP
ncbi:hypothetical protein [Roseococcus sp. YIM B11640]|uniref:hypothetical protein n=1 Tax=Roseococcus sp. YIM B11640 TaxID=3133973 RepID=UPI003C7ABBFE